MTRKNEVTSPCEINHREELAQTKIGYTGNAWEWKFCQWLMLRIYHASATAYNYSCGGN
jgi:hypothetical protein